MPDAPTSERTLVALSGGVDSSVAAALCHGAGVPVTAAYMKNWINEDEIVGHCPWMEDVEDARAVCATLGIPFEIVNLMSDYKSRIVEYMLQGYAEGVTPNPDVYCNREIKFGVFLSWALDHGFDAVATGHYARSHVREDGRREIHTGRDPNKDQSYFLSLMTHDQIQRARFPVGHLPKPEVRETARRFGLPNADKKDSQGICFIGEVKMTDFIRTYLPDKPGDIVDLSGNVLGRHRGLHTFTLGQRKGIGVPSNTFGEAYVVLEKRLDTDELVVGFDRPDTPLLYASECELASVNDPFGELARPRRIEARCRYRAPSVPVETDPLGEGRLGVRWSAPQRALAAGQICALYDGERLLGGGVYARILHDTPA